jgi:glycosyltransferase involved in cell wall biosynthesis
MINVSPLVSIIVPCLNEQNHIEAAIRSILCQESNARELEVIVADGLSDDGTRDILARLARLNPRLRIVDNPRRLVSAGLNEAIRCAKGDVIIRMDAHTTYASDYVQQCIQVLNETAADNVGGPWVPKGSTPIGRAVTAVFHSRFGTGGPKGHDPNYVGPVDTVYLGCWPRGVFDRYGMFDEELVRNQDDDFNLRICRSGGTVWQSPKIRSMYHPRETLSELFEQYAQYGYWKVRILQKHKIPASIRHLIPGLFVGSLLALTMMAPFWHLAFSLWGVLFLMYMSCTVVASTVITYRRGWQLFLYLPIVFACYHFAYGWGFLRGIYDFIILRRGAARAYVRLTRPQRAKTLHPVINADPGPVTLEKDS